MKYYCGIDLGTTNSTVSVIGIDRNQKKNFNEKIKSIPIYQYDSNRFLTKTSYKLPSVIYFDLESKSFYTGEYAKKIYEEGKDTLRCISSIKNFIGTESVVEIEGKNKYYFDMAQCSSLLLKTIKKSLEEQLGVKFKSAVVTIPAAFNVEERQDTERAMYLAGFKEVFILDEPTAVILDYINDNYEMANGEKIGEKTEYKLVYDIGGGTTDVTIAKIYTNDEANINMDIVARSPRMDFGGNDINKIFAAYFLHENKEIKERIENLNDKERLSAISVLLANAEREKITINNMVKKYRNNEKRLKKLYHRVNFAINEDIKIKNLILSKEIVDKLFEEFFQEQNSKILKPIIKTLSEGNLEKNQIRQIILAGGSSKFYIVEDVLKRYFGQGIKIKYVKTELAVSRGAAIYNYHINGGLDGVRLYLDDKMSEAIYIKDGENFNIFIPKTVREGDKGFYTYEVKEDNCKTLDLNFFYGNGEDIEEYMPIRCNRVNLNQRIEKGTKINIYWSFCKNKNIEIEIYDLKSSFKLGKREFRKLENQEFLDTLKVNGDS